jgi:predicted DNA-binding transcriptional regulator AlpA
MSEITMSRKLLRKSSVLDKFPCGNTKFYELIREKKLPAPIKIGRVSMWVEAEIDAAIDRLVAECREPA